MFSLARVLFAFFYWKHIVNSVKHLFYFTLSNICNQVNSFWFNYFYPSVEPMIYFCDEETKSRTLKIVSFLVSYGGCGGIVFTFRTMAEPLFALLRCPKFIAAWSADKYWPLRHNTLRCISHRERLTVVLREPVGRNREHTHSTKRKPPKLGGFILWLRGQDANYRRTLYIAEFLSKRIAIDCNMTAIEIYF